MSNLDPNVAKLSPSLYSAAYYANLNPSQINQVNQIAGTVSLNKELSSLPTNAAQERWKQLDPHAQEQIRAMYGDASYIPKQTDNLVWRGIKDVTNTLTGPFKAAFKVAGEYNRLVPSNAPYLVLRQIQQGASPFDVSVYKKAWDGTQVFDNQSLTALYQEYGKTDTFVAMKTLQGLKPGEIVDAYGRVDSDIIKSLTKMFNDPEQFQNMMNKFKGAQVSVGRDIGRVMMNASPTDNKLYGSSKWNKTTGFFDAVTQIITDPLTWITGGTSKAVTKADRLAEILAKDPSEANVAKIFARPDVKSNWDSKVGPMIKAVAEAPDAKARAMAIEDIRYNLPSLNNREILNSLAEEKVFDAASAANYFSKSEAMLDLFAGRVDGTTFFRNGIPLAKNSRLGISGINKKLGDWFNGSLEDAKVTSLSGLVEDVRKVGLAAEPITSAQTPVLESISKEMYGIRRKLGRLAARFPGNTAIGVTDETVHASLPAVTALARTIYPKAHAQYFTEAFLDSTAYDRVILLRGLYTQIMHNMGLHATPEGQRLMEKILQEKFADTTTFSSRSTLDVPPQFANAIKSRDILLQQPEGGMGGLLTKSTQGPVHFYNGKPRIGNLPWSKSQDGEASLADYAFNLNEPGSAARELIDAVGGATRNNILRKLVNGWSVATLFPRLGIRSAIDEAFFYCMMAPGEDLVRFASGRKFNKSMIAFSGNDKAIPPISRAIQDFFQRNPAKYLGTEARYNKAVLNGQEYFILKDREDIARMASKILENNTGAEGMEWMYQAMVHHPEIVSSMVNSIIGKSAFEGGMATDELAASLISNNKLVQMHKDLNLTSTGNFQEYSVEDLSKINESLVSAAHYKNFVMRFLHNHYNFTDKKEGFIDAGESFIRNNAVRTEKDFVAMRDEILSKVGINPETMAVTNGKALNKFLEQSQQSARNAEKGWSGVDTAVDRVETMITDMYNTFHGGAVAFNDRLLQRIKEVSSYLQETEKLSYSKSIREALKSMSYSNFEESTRGFRPMLTINTDLNLAKDASEVGFMQKIRDWADTKGATPMEWMDAQNNHLFRQPALWSGYIALRARYQPLEKKFISELMKEQGYSLQLATELAEKKFTETAMNHAANNLLKYVDNPQIRSNLAWTLRTSGRFYRATEDFYRRVYRLKNVSPQVLYRLRLAHLGLQSNGFIHPDQNGDPYLIMPADNIIFHAINGSMAVFGANVKQPLFNDFAVKLSMGNPSFQQDAGQPSLSGPFAAVPVLALQKVLSGWGGDIGKQIALQLDNLVLGNVNQNLTWTKAIVPSSISRVWAMLPKGEQDQQETSAAMQAIAYNAAHGLFLSPEKLATMPDAERTKAVSDYLKQIKITAHNVIFMRSFLGLLSPISPSMQESRDLPDYLKNVGVNGLRPEFADILQSVMKNSKGQIRDPYEAALMAFVGKNPGKLVYTVARDDKQVNVMVNKTKEVQNWMLNNSYATNTYGDAALIFAPHVGQYNSDTYLWMQAAGMLKQRKLNDYFDEVSVAQDRQKYFDYKSQAEIAMMDPSLNAIQRQQVLDTLKGAQDSLKKANPGLEAALNSKSFGIGKQEKMMTDLAGILADSKVPMTDAVRTKMSTALVIVQRGLDAIKNDITSDVLNSGASKQEVKDRVIKALSELGGSEGKKAPSDPVVAEATRAIFLPILDFYVRNNMKAGA